MFVPRIVLETVIDSCVKKKIEFDNLPSTTRERSFVFVCREIDGTIILPERFLNSTILLICFLSRDKRSTLIFEAENSLFPLWWWRAAYCFRQDSKNIFVNARRSWNHLFGNEIAPIIHLMKIYVKCVKFGLMCIKVWAKARDPKCWKKIWKSGKIF